MSTPTGSPAHSDDMVSLHLAHKDRVSVRRVVRRLMGKSVKVSHAGDGRDSPLDPAFGIVTLVRRDGFMVEGAQGARREFFEFTDLICGLVRVSVPRQVSTSEEIA